jgi:hypothetical protein
MTYRDPSGLAPEKEKEGERLLFFETNWAALYPLYAALWEENERRANQSPANADGSPLNDGVRMGSAGGYNFGYRYWTDGYNFERSYYINNHEGSFSYDEWGTNEYGFDVVRGRNVDISTIPGVDQKVWLD